MLRRSCAIAAPARQAVILRRIAVGSAPKYLGASSCLVSSPPSFRRIPSLTRGGPSQVASLGWLSTAAQVTKEEEEEEVTPHMEPWWNEMEAELTQRYDDILNELQNPQRIDPEHARDVLVWLQREASALASDDSGREYRLTLRREKRRRWKEAQHAAAAATTTTTEGGLVSRSSAPMEDSDDNGYDDDDDDDEIIEEVIPSLDITPDDSMMNASEESMPGEDDKDLSSLELKETSLLDLLNDDDDFDDDDDDDDENENLTMANENPPPKEGSFLDVFVQDTESDAPNKPITSPLLLSFLSDGEPNLDDDDDELWKPPHFDQDTNHEDALGETVSKEETESEGLHRPLHQFVALLSVLSRADWFFLSSHPDSSLDDVTEEYKDEEEAALGESVTEDQDAGVVSGADDNHQGLLSAEINDETPPKPDVSSTVRRLLSGLRLGRWTFSTAEWNMLLVYVAMSMSESADRHVDLLLLILEEFLETGGVPDAMTYSIAMLALWKRGLATSAAAQVCEQMMSHCGAASFVSSTTTKDDKKSPWSSLLGNDQMDLLTRGHHNNQTKLRMHALALDVGMKCLGLQNKLAEAKGLMEWALSDEGEGILIPTRAFVTLLDLYRNADLKDDAMQLLEICVVESARWDPRGMNDFLRKIATWPVRRDDGVRIRTGSHCEALVEYLTEKMQYDVTSFLYRPSMEAWKKLMMASSKAARLESLRYWSCVRTACVSLLREFPSGRHDADVWHLGLDAAEALHDAELAVDLLSWTLAGATREAWDSAEPTLLRMSPHALYRTVQLCVGWGEMALAENALQEIVHCCVPDDHQKRMVPDSVLRRLHTIVMAGHAKDGNVEKAKVLLTLMQQQGPSPSDNTYAAYIQTLANAGGRVEEAVAMIDSMLENHGVRPGPSCFDAAMIAALCGGEWNQVLDLHRKMCESKVPGTPVTVHAVVLASLRNKDVTGAMAALQRAVETCVPMNGQDVLTSLQLLLPPPKWPCQDWDNLGTYLHKLRNEDNDDDEAKDSNQARVALRLARLIREAQWEDTRHQEEPQWDKKTKKQTTADQRRFDKWRQVLQAALEFLQLQRDENET